MFTLWTRFILAGSVCLGLLLAPVARAGWMLTPEDETVAPETPSDSSGPGSTGSTSAPTNKPQPSSGGFGGFDETAPAVKGFEVTLISAKKLNDNSIRVGWENPDNAKNYILTIYRGTNQLNSASRLSSARIVKQYTTASNGYTDAVATSGTYYYAVTVTADGNENKDLTPDQSMTTSGVSVTIVAPVAPATVVAVRTQAAAPVPTVPVQVTGLTVSLQNANQAVLSWNRTAGDDVQYNVYRSKTVILVSSDLKELAKTLPDLSYTETLSVDGNYYYAVTAKNAVGENRRVAAGTNASSSAIVYAVPVVVVPVSVVTQKPVAAAPVAVQTQKPAATAVVVPAVVVPAVVVRTQVQSTPPAAAKDYDFIMLTLKRRYFYTEDYAEAIDRLEALVEDPDCPETVRDEAWLFLGKACYYTKDFARALKIMVRVRQVYPDEADFWISRIASKL